MAYGKNEIGRIDLSLGTVHSEAQNLGKQIRQDARNYSFRALRALSPKQLKVRHVGSNGFMGGAR
jgi:hypothetical protein